MRVRAIIIQNNQILLIKRIKQDKKYWVFPGGGVESSDSSPEAALKRECQEELGIQVKVEELFDTYNGNEKELFFLCNVISGQIDKIGGPEASRDKSISGEYEPIWLPIGNIANKNILPESIKQSIIIKKVDK